ncbi:unnamed protein product [Microthlaspi erraticum]|uniref:Integrase catalytic domain-containing protein n=1 Tax=Microthlaspi erraticum TaxID=1685480 RepID=A0A6D2K0I3_9BRAS|nr:unnamed protein product [Microthlaspi erraticum]
MLAHFGMLRIKHILFDDNLDKVVPLSKSEEKKPAVADDDGSATDSPSASDPLTKTVPDLVKHDQNERAMGIIIANIDNVVLRKIKHCTTAADMWALLDRLYTESSLPNRIHLQMKFYTFKMKETMTVDQTVDDFLKIVAEMGNLEIEVSDEVQAILFLTSLSPGFDQLKHTLKYGRETLKLEDVISAAKSKEREFPEGQRSDKGSALYSEDRGRSSTKGKSDRSRSRSNSKSKLTCWFCKKEGHLKKDCFARKKKLQNEGLGEAGVIIEKLVFTEALSANDQDSKEQWVIDSGCTYHMTSRKDWFSEFNENASTTILLGDNHTVESKGCGSVKLRTNGGSIKVLNNVRYVPNLRRNLISTGTLDKLGYTHEGGDGVVSFFKNKKLALCGILKNGLYILDGRTSMSEACNVELSKNKTALWHSRLGHLSLNNMKILSGKGLLEKSDVKDLSFCEHCVMGKSKKLSFNVGKHDTEDALGYVHADLWGSQNVTSSHSGNKYFLSIIDDKTRKVWLMFLKTKDETFKNFCEWKDLVENQIDKKVKVLRTDNGLEFCNTRFDEYCKRHGIERHRTCTYTPQQNGVAERMNRTVMEKVRCLLDESGLGEVFWAEAVATAVYLINRSPSSAVDHNVPEQFWLNRKPGYKHLRRFGSVAYVHQDQGKLKPRALKGVFLGYPQGTKGYKIWLIEEEKCVTSRNVIFHEDLVFKDLKSEGRIQQVSRAYPSIREFTENSPEDVTEKETTKIAESSSAGGAIPVSSSDSESEEPENNGETETSAEPQSYCLARDRPRREIKLPVKLNDYTEFGFALLAAENVDIEEPQCYHDAKRSEDWVKWNDGMIDEMKSLWKNNTWIIVDRPIDKKVISCRWLYRKKPGIPMVEPERFKARVVARGFTQREGIDYDEVFAPVVKHISIKILMFLVVQENLELEQMDVKTAFLHGDIDRELYIEQPEGFEVNPEKDQVCLLKKSLYGLKQAPRQWNMKFDTFMKNQKFTRSIHDSCVYVKEVGHEDYIYLLLYVDDMFLAARSMTEIRKLKNVLSQEFEMKDMGAASRILGIDIKRDREKGTLCLSQSRYIEKVIQRFNMSGAKIVTTPIGAHFRLSSTKEDEEGVDIEIVPYSSAVGSIMYAMVGTRPDVAYAIGLVSRFMSKPGAVHWEAVKWLLRYLRSSTDLNLVYTKGENFRVQGYCDSDYAGDLDRRRSISGYVFTVGGNTVSWKSSLQSIAALSTTEAEYIALTKAVKEAIWIRGLLIDMGLKAEKASVWCDSQSAICLSKNNAFHERTKHMATKFNFIRDIIEEGEVEVLKIHTSENPADMLTKGIHVKKFDSALEFLKLIR